MSKLFKDAANIARINGILENQAANMNAKEMAKEILTEENYNKFMKSYKTTYWLQLGGVIACFIISCAIFLIIFRQWDVCLIGIAFGIILSFIWLLITLILPQTRIYIKFTNWCKKAKPSLEELDEIFN